MCSQAPRTAVLQHKDQQVPKPGPRKDWTDAAVKQLRADYDRIPVSSLARKLKRSEGAVRQKAFSLGLKRTRGPANRFAAAEKKRAAKKVKAIKRTRTLSAAV